MTAIVPDYQTPERMALKRRAVPLPDVAGKRVLDVGCDMGAWSFLAAEGGATKVLGLDRNRDVKQQGPMDLIEINRAEAQARGLSAVCEFSHLDLGNQWREFGRFDVILMLSVYHHVFENCGDHRPIWFWLWRHCATDGVLLWEGPLDDSDPVVRANVSDANRKGFTRAAIMKASAEFFDCEFIGPALHEPTRQVWRFRPRTQRLRVVPGTIVAGAGGASKAFAHAKGRRMDEIETAIGVRPRKGSLNIECSEPFDWERGYYRAQILDVVNRSAGLNSEWAPRWARFYPLTIESLDAIAFRFEGEHYPDSFVELISATRLRELIGHDRVMLCN